MNVNICKYSCLSYDFEGTDYLGYEDQRILARSRRGLWWWGSTFKPVSAFHCVIQRTTMYWNLDMALNYRYHFLHPIVSLHHPRRNHAGNSLNHKWISSLLTHLTQNPTSQEDRHLQRAGWRTALSYSTTRWRIRCWWTRRHSPKGRHSKNEGQVCRFPSTSLKDEQDKLDEEGYFLTSSTILFTWECKGA